MPTEAPPPVASSRKDFGLNPLERQLIALIAAGYTSGESTRRLGISAQALRQHLMDIFDKLQVSNHLELVLFAIYHQLIDVVPTSPPGR